MHPDRNYGNGDDSTRLFAEIQIAYEILSDPQERAWYDSHEAQFLNDDNINGSNTLSSQNLQFRSGIDVLQIMRNFHGAVVFTDGPTGFFGFLRNAFALLAKEEMEAVAKQGLDSSIEYPSFGYESDNYESTVKQFYTAWSNFATQKTFVWKDFYKYTNAQDRRYRRAMEKENKRFREDGIREFNDAVRSLVAFVRKRDPRYIPSKQTEAERQNALRDLAVAQAARSRAANEVMLKDQMLPDWVVARESEEQLVSEESVIEEQHFECVACGKTFKSEKQYWVHESSKKHQKAVYALKKHMRRENKNFHLQGAGKVYENDSPESETLSQCGNNFSDGGNKSSQEHGKSEPAVGSYIAKHPIRTDSEEAIIKIRLGDTQDIEENEQQFEYTEKVKNDLADSPDSEFADCSSTDTSSVFPKQKQGKAAQKRAKRALRQAESNISGLKHTCGACGSSFQSRTRMFQHISDNKHEILVPKSQNRGKGKKNR